MYAWCAKVCGCCNWQVYVVAARGRPMRLLQLAGVCGCCEWSMWVADVGGQCFERGWVPSVFDL